MRVTALAAPFLAAALLAGPARAQGGAGGKKCVLLCAPSLLVRPSVSRSHFLDHPRVRSLATGAVTELPSKTNVFLDLHLNVPTQIPRTTLYLATHWFPWARARTNPFTEYSASQIGEDVIRANLPAVSYGAAFALLPPEATGGWLGLVPYVGGVLSPAARPEAGSDYTHKLDLGLDASLGLFDWLPAGTWLHSVRGYALFDWTATGLPHEGDEIPDGERVYLDGVRGFSLSAGLALPAAPLGG